MKKLLVFFIVFFGFFKSDYAITIIRTECKESYNKILENYIVEINGDLFGDYYSSLNGGVYTKINKKELFGGNVILIIDKLVLKEGKNILRINYNQSQFAETEVNFITPSLKILSVIQGSENIISNSGLYVVNSNEKLTINLLYNLPQVSKTCGSAVIKKIRYYYSKWDSLNSPGGKIEIGNLNYGFNNLIIQAVNSNGFGYKFDTVSVFYIDFKLPEGIVNNEFLKVNKNYVFNGFPQGGFFEGSGILTNSGIYNPSKPLGNTDLVTYNYVNTQYKVKISKMINLKPVKPIKINGNQQVCTNSQEIKYFANGFENYSCNYEWSLWQNGKKVSVNSGVYKYSTDSSSIRVNWNKGISNGLIKLDMTIKNGIDFTLKDSIFVNVNPEVVPDKSYSFFIDKDSKLIVCSDSSANYYEWYMNNNPLGITQVPYKVFTNFIATSKDTFYVRTSYNKACWQESYKCTTSEFEDINKFPDLWAFNFEEISNFKEKVNLSIFPNPVVDYIGIQLHGSLKKVNVQIFNFNGQILFSKYFDSFSGLLNINTSDMNNGIYFLKLLSENNEAIVKRIIISKN